MSVKAVAFNFFASCLIMAALLVTNVGGAWAQSFTGLSKASPQPAAGALSAGLAVRYYGAKYNHIRELVEMMDYQKGTQGKPIPMLNYHVGRGNVLTTTTTDLMGADITGFIHLAKAGKYTFLVQSNDGVRLEIGGKQIYEDPDVHSDRFSDELFLEISDPGWYPIRVLYFEKKATSTLELYWQVPGSSDADFVPADAFAHLKK